MAALLPKHRRRKRCGVTIVNRYVTVEGRSYRICTTGGHLLMVMLKCSAGGERALDTNGRRARRIVRLADEQGKST